MSLWLGKNPIFVDGVQVAEVLKDLVHGFLIRNLRPNGSVGVCHSGDRKSIRDWLDANYPEWTTLP